MTDLIEELETTTEGSRELDWKIWEAVKGKWKIPIQKNTCPRYTESIDDILTLMPDGYFGGVRFFTKKPTAWVRHLGCALIRGQGSTPALALCVVIMKAREL